MARDGAFDGLDAAVTWHPGEKSFTRGGSTNPLDSIVFEFYGETAHSARDPWNGRSALDGVEIMNYGVNMMREHVIEPVKIHYVITDGGVAPTSCPPTRACGTTCARQTVDGQRTERTRAQLREGGRAGFGHHDEGDAPHRRITRIFPTAPSPTACSGTSNSWARTLFGRGEGIRRKLGYEAPLSEDVSPRPGGHPPKQRAAAT